MRNRTLIIIFAVLIIASAGAYFLFGSHRDNKTEAVITLRGEVIHRIDLQSVENSYTIDVEGSTIYVEKGRICMLEADCPDKLCVKSGFSSGPAKPIVCLPKQIVINISSASTPVDAVAG